MGINNYSQIQSTLYPTSGATAVPLLRSSSGAMSAYGTVVPVDGTAGYAKGCIFHHTDGGAGRVLYINDGTNTSSSFRPFSSSDAYGTASGKGPSPAIWQDAPVLDTMLDPTLGIYFFDDFLSTINIESATNTGGWTLTQVDTKGTITSSKTIQGGAVTVTSATGDSADDGANVQLKNCAFKPAAGVKIYFETRVKMGDATQQYYIGLAAVDTTLIAAGVVDDVVDKAGFFHHAASTDNKISAICSRTSSEEIDADIATNTDATWIKLGFIIDGLTSVTYYANGVEVASCVDTSDIPNALMCLSAVAQYESADGVMDIDWVRILQTDGRN